MDPEPRIIMDGMSGRSQVKRAQRGKFVDAGFKIKSERELGIFYDDIAEDSMEAHFHRCDGNKRSCKSL